MRVALRKGLAAVVAHLVIGEAVQVVHLAFARVATSHVLDVLGGVERLGHERREVALCVGAEAELEQGRKGGHAGVSNDAWSRDEPAPPPGGRWLRAQARLTFQASYVLEQASVELGRVESRYA